MTEMFGSYAKAVRIASEYRIELSRAGVFMGAAQAAAHAALSAQVLAIDELITRLRVAEAKEMKEFEGQMAPKE